MRLELRDVIYLTETVVATGDKIASAPAELPELQKDLRNVLSCLKKIESATSRGDQSGEQLDDLDDLLKSCRSAVREADEIVTILAESKRSSRLFGGGSKASNAKKAIPAVRNRLLEQNLALKDFLTSAEHGTLARIQAQMLEMHLQMQSPTISNTERSSNGEGAIVISPTRQNPFRQSRDSGLSPSNETYVPTLEVHSPVENQTSANASQDYSGLEVDTRAMTTFSRESYVSTLEVSNASSRSTHSSQPGLMLDETKLDKDGRRVPVYGGGNLRSSASMKHPGYSSGLTVAGKNMISYAREGKLQKLRELMSSDPITSKDQNALNQALVEAAGVSDPKTDHDNIVTLLLLNGASPNCQGTREKRKAKKGEGPVNKYARRTPLIWAMCARRYSTIRMLVDHGADPNLADEELGMPPLAWAAVLEMPDIIRLLFDRSVLKPEIDAMCREVGQTPLLYAASMGNDRSLHALLENGASISATNYSKMSALLLAFQNRQFEVARSLLAAGADPNSYMSSVPLLHWTIRQNDRNLDFFLDILVSSNVDVNSKDDYYMPAIASAARLGYARYVRVLLAAGADIHLTDEGTGRTALIWAIGESQYDVIKMLLDKGADTSLQDKQRLTALDWAEEMGNRGIIELVQSKRRTDARMANARKT